MASKHSNNAGTMMPEKIDNLKLIRGIGPAIEQHLQEAGIYTFSQLAALTPEELAGITPTLSKLTSERIASMDWIGQARKLASEKEPMQPFLSTPASEGRQRYSTFTVELLLDEDNKIRRTRVVHVQSGKESAWASWNPKRLENLILEGIAQKREQAAALSGELRLQDLLVIREENRAVSRMLRYGQPYFLYPVLDFASVISSGDLPFHYVATVYAHNLDTLLREEIGTATGTIQKLENSMIYIRGKNLNRGIYRLEAVVIFSSEGGVLPHASLMAMLEGNLLQVY